MPHLPPFGRVVDRRPVHAPDDALSQDRWTDSGDELIRLNARITDNNIGGSDPTLQVRAHDGVNWTIELASRSRNARAGLTESQALPGDQVSVVGRRTAQFGENRIKATHVTIGDKTFDLSEEGAA
ncbi:hypothetical protein JHW45_16045 [Paracoccus stylophorae]|uniref:Uncharacterized protein n=1 Tax=Paracoccus stylophorae TaxID=659350 RepID=A0ABY7SVX8_9RHOB|nr:hypothetical protein [Paracoccus stylophorae]WCR10542.1 hypothetical protein JHW45_16045 [Paracoccus stylophorae]